VTGPAAGQPEGQPADDLSMNETPWPPPAAITKLVEEGLPRLHRYPDYAARELVAALAQRLRVTADQVLAGPGSAGLCQHLIQAIGIQAIGPQRPDVVHAHPSFEAYPLMIANAGARAVPVPLADGRHDLTAMAAAIDANTRCVLVCNPNNPTGTALGRRELEAFLRQVPPEVVVLLDEAYREFVTDQDVPDGVELSRDHGNLCVLRTFSKAYGLAALRVGYAVAPPALTAAARRMGQMFFPGSLGQEAALASLAPDVAEEVAARCAALAAERDKLREALLGVGYDLAPSQANFLWLPLGADAGPFAAHCQQARILIRGYPGLGVRVTIGSQAANERFLAAATAFRSGLAPHTVPTDSGETAHD
jgi:histidinol-phosphate aminotransferase